MLVETIVVIALISPISVSTAWSLRNDVNHYWKTILIGLGPVIDAWIVWFFISLFDLSLVATWSSVFAFGIMSNLLIAAILSPRRLLVFRLAMQNIRKRSRQSALLVAGLLVTSAIITSSLVVGDSLDATMSSEIEAVYGETDVIITHKDQRTGLDLDISQNLTSKFGSTLSSKGVTKSWEHGLETIVTMNSSDGRATPSAKWFAYEDWNGIAVNKVASEELEVSVGDVIMLKWYESNSDGELNEEFTNLTISEVITMEGKGSMSGTRSPALFTPLDFAQDIQDKFGFVNCLRLSLVDNSNVNSTISVIESIFDEIIVADDSGFELIEDGDLISISKSTGIGRLDVDFMNSWNDMSLQLLEPNGTSLEILQVPLKEIESNRYLLSLPDDQIKQIIIGSEGDWYVSSGSVSYQNDRGGLSHKWAVPNGGLINDVELNGSSLLVAHTYGISEISSDSKDEIVTHESGDEFWIATQPSLPLPELPNTVFSIDHLQVEEGEWLAVKHLTGSTIYEKLQDEWIELNYSGEWLHYDNEIYFGSPSGWVNKTTSSPEGWSGLQNGLLLNGTKLHSISGEILTNMHQYCDGNFATYDGDLLCTTSIGTLVRESEGLVTPRLALSVEIGGFGETPQLLLSTNNEISPDIGQILISDRLSLLPSNESIRVNGLIPWAYGDAEPISLNVNGNMSSIDAPGMEELQELIIGIVNISDGERLSSAEEGERSVIVVSNGNYSAIAFWLDEISTTETMGLEIDPAKEEALIAAENSSGVFAIMFLVFGTFTIASGVLLAITIIFMLSESRKLEGAIVRAVGLKRSDLRALMIIEGSFLSGIACIAGGMLGLVLASIISYTFSNAFSSAGAIGISFNFEWDSLLTGISIGFIIAISVLWFTSMWTSRLNVVQALRNLSPLRMAGIPWWFYLLLILLFGGSIILLLYMILIPASSSLRYALWNLSGPLMLLGLVPIFTFAIPHARKRNIRNVGRNTMAFSGLILIAWTVLFSSSAPVDSDVQKDEFTFIILGFVEVLAGVLLLSGLAPIVANYMSKSTIVTRRIGPSATVAIAHPNASPTRTAIIMAMFSLTIFSVVVLAGYSVQFEEHSQGYVEDASGEFEILLTSSRMLPINLDSDPDLWGLDSEYVRHIDSVAKVSRAVAWVEKGEDKVPYILRGVDNSFITHGGLPLESWDPALGQTQEEAWISLNSRNDVVFIDSSFALVDPNTGASMVGVTISIGESISLIDISNPGNVRNFTVGGILSESSYLFSSGIWMNTEIVEEQYGGVVTRTYVSHSTDIDSNELSNQLSEDLSSKGIHVVVIEDEILIILGLVFQILDIFQSYLALGLIVGIAGIGVVTYRSVSERTGQIGMLRALGFRKRLVMLSLLIEILWVSLLGMLNGAIIGILFHIGLHNAFWVDRGAELILPWSTLVWLLSIATLFVILATAVPVIRASKITPAMALTRID